MFKNLLALAMVMGPDEDGQAGNGGGEQDPGTPATGSPNVPPVEQPGAPAPDYRAEFENLNGQFERYKAEQQKYFDSMQQKYEENLKGVRETMQRYFDPEGYKKSQEPKPLTQEDIDNRFAQMEQNFRKQQLQESIRRELPEAMSKFPVISKAFGEGAQRLVMAQWVNGPYRSIVDAAADVAAGLEKFSTTAVDTQRAEWEKKKKETMEQLGSASGTRSGPAVTKEVPKNVGKGSGKLRFDGIDFEQALRDAKGD